MSKTTPTSIVKKAKSKATQKRKKANEWFFKTGPGEYGEGDKFIGLSMPQIRKLSAECNEFKFNEIKKLINSPLHEIRMLGLIILVNQYKKCKTDKQRKSIYTFYLKNKKAANNWDLVDVTCPKIIGDYMLNVDKSEQKKLKVWAKSKNMWVRRIAIVTTWHFNFYGYTKPTFELSKLLLNDKEDLLHKACGWMLREAGKKDEKALVQFLKTHYKKMPRTMLRYSIEKFPPARRQKMLKGIF